VGKRQISQRLAARIDRVLDVLRRPLERLVAIAGAGGGAARLALLLFNLHTLEKAVREGQYA
jgi:hypothetical protein